MKRTLPCLALLVVHHRQTELRKGFGTDGQPRGVKVFQPQRVIIDVNSGQIDQGSGRQAYPWQRHGLGTCP